VALTKLIAGAPYRVGPRLAIAMAALCFFLLGLLFLPYLGFEYDEVAFVPLIFHPNRSLFAARIFHRFIPLMQMSYAGALKTWLYAPLMNFWRPGLYSVRLPTLVLASLTVVLVGETVRRRGSSRAALFTVALLATDISFLLCSTFDWGPVVIQNFLLASSLYLILVRRATAFGLPLAAFALGLALWDKAIFLWILSALCLAAVIFGLGVLRREANLKRFVGAALAFAVGISPLIVYNVKRRNQTLSSNAHFSFADVPPKFTVAQFALNGQAFPNFFVDGSAPRSIAPHPNASAAGDANKRLPPNPSSWRFPAFACLLVAGAACARPEKRRLILCLWCAVILAWLQSAITRDAGVFVHHVVIFYPALFICLGLAGEAIASRLRRYGTLFLAVAGISLCAGGLNNIYAQFLDFRQFSPTKFWTDADQQLFEYIASHRNRRILIADWGIATQADTRLSGSIPIEEISFRLKDGNSTADEAHDWARSRSLIVVHTADHEMFFDQRAKLARLAQSSGSQVVPVATIGDRAGHPMFEVDELSPLPPK
jgi:hypothetical protein